MGFFEEKSADLNAIENDIIGLLSYSRFTSLKEVQEFRTKYKLLVKRINDINESVKNDRTQLAQPNQKKLLDRCSSLAYDLDWVYNDRSIDITEFILAKAEENEQALAKTQDDMIEAQKVQEKIEESLRNTQGIQLTVFSIVLTILAFVLTNAKVLADANIVFKNVLLVNISYLFSADAFFTLIYIFLGPVFHNNLKKPLIAFMIIMPILLVTALVLVAICMP